MDKKTSTMSELAKAALQPQEMLLPVKERQGKLFIGVPKELSFQEKRVALNPKSVALLVNRGHRVVIEAGAGEKSSFSDHDYSEAGAEIAFDLERVFEAHIILKAAPPTAEEIQLMKMNQIVFSPLHLPTMEPEYVRALMNKKVTAFAYEYIKDDAGNFPVVRTLSEIAGSASILIASEYLSNTRDGSGILLGGISGVPPARVVILGAGVVGEFATRTALGLGAEVRVFDNNIYKLMRLQNNVNSRVFTSIIHPDLLMEELSKADVAVGGIHSESGESPCIVSEDMVRQMKPGSVIVDVSIDQGGCFETSRVTSHSKPTFVEYDVIHYCVPNIASRVARTSSAALSHVVTPILLNAQQDGGLERSIASHEGIRHGVYIYQGRLTNRHLSKRFKLKFTNLELLLAAKF